MNHTGNAGRPRIKPPELKGKTQFERFVETAKALDVDESGKKFEKAFKAVVPTKTSSSRKSGIEPEAEV